MNIHQVSFAKIIVLRNDLAEVIVHSGVDINLSMVGEIHETLQSLFNFLTFHFHYLSIKRMLIQYNLMH
jgi:hypothetical protein